jgi:hypothetical protein
LQRPGLRKIYRSFPGVIASTVLAARTGRLLPGRLALPVKGGNEAQTGRWNERSWPLGLHIAAMSLCFVALWIIAGRRGRRLRLKVGGKPERIPLSLTVCCHAGLCRRVLKLVTCRNWAGEMSWQSHGCHPDRPGWGAQGHPTLRTMVCFTGTAQFKKVFCFFFSKKKRLLAC